MDMDLRL